MKDVVDSLPKFLWVADAGGDEIGVVALLCLFYGGVVFGESILENELVSCTVGLVPNTVSFTTGYLECT